jgi:hypothetical protein
MTTERKSLLAIVLGRLVQGAVPIDGMHIWEPAGALKFTLPKPPVKRTATEKAPQAAATAGHRACPL